MVEDIVLKQMRGTGRSQKFLREEAITEDWP